MLNNQRAYVRLDSTLKREPYINPVITQKAYLGKGFRSTVLSNQTNYQRFDQTLTLTLNPQSQKLENTLSSYHLCFVYLIHFVLFIHLSQHTALPT